MTIDQQIWTTLAYGNERLTLLTSAHPAGPTDPDTLRLVLNTGGTYDLGLDQINGLMAACHAWLVSPDR